MSIGPGEILILLLVLVPVLLVLGGLSTIVYFVMRKPTKRPCRACGLPNVRVREQCMRCGVIA